jgi:RNA polymerase sigma-70 factor (ECF subfamily)
VDLTRQREVVDAFLAAARGGDFATLLQVLDPDVVLRSDTGGGRLVVLHGAETVARNAMTFARYSRSAQAVLVNGAAGVMAWDADGNALSVMGFIVAGGRIVEMDALADPSRLAHLKLSAFTG